jgi:hypothetical protein
MKKIDKLYKYRTVNDYSLKAIKDHYIWLASPDKFNDPFDCHLSDDYIVYDEYSKEDDETGLLENYNKKYYENVIYPAFLKNGIGCFCEASDVILLWSHYAANHTGFCLEYDLSICNEDLKSIFHKVNYTMEYPKLNFHEFLTPGMENTYNYLKKTLYTKFKAWEYEKEWRLILPGFNNKAFNYPENFLSSIYLGCAIKEDDRQSILSVFSDKEYKPKIYQYKMSKYSFSLEFVPIY